MNLTTRPVLVLNSSYEPCHITSARRALTLVCKDAAIIEEAEEGIMAYKDVLPLPSVIRLKTYKRFPYRSPIVTRRNILTRDNYECLYCGLKFQAGDLTLDHIVPRSKGGRSSFENLATACRKCNHTKADKTLEESGMRLLRTPRAITVHTPKFLVRSLGRHNSAWQKYLYIQNNTPQEG
jgi:hypothetical protein